MASCHIDVCEMAAHMGHGELVLPVGRCCRRRAANRSAPPSAAVGVSVGCTSSDAGFGNLWQKNTFVHGFLHSQTLLCLVHNQSTSNFNCYRKKTPSRDCEKPCTNVFFCHFSLSRFETARFLPKGGGDATTPAAPGCFLCISQCIECTMKQRSALSAARLPG